jgi:hypothetical protein
LIDDEEGDQDVVIGDVHPVHNRRDARWVAANRVG